jgi:hypothetical protein
MNYKVRREVEVAFSKHSQPIWFRILKYSLLALLIYFFYGDEEFWIGFGVFLVIAMILHFWYRYKTNGWTKSYGLWNYEKNQSKLKR